MNVCDDAAFAMVNSFFSLEDYKAVVRASEDFDSCENDASLSSSKYRAAKRASKSLPSTVRSWARDAVAAIA